MTRTVCVIDSCWAGSIITYHRLFVEVFLRLGCNVISLSPAPDAMTKHVAAMHPEVARDRFRAELFEDPLADQPPVVSLLYRITRRSYIDRLTGLPPTFRSLR